MPDKMNLAQIAGLLGGELDCGDQPASEGGAIEVSGVAGLDEAGPAQLSFFSDRRYLGQLSETRAGGVLAASELREEVESAPCPLIWVEDPSRAMVTLVEQVAPPVPGPPPGVHPSATVDPTATLGEDVAVGPNVVVEAGASVGAGSILSAGSYVGHGTQLGECCRLFPGVVLYHGVRLGARVTIHANTVVGSDGFGYIEDNGHRKVPQIGTVVIGDDVEIGAACTIDRARLGETVIGAGSKIDNLVHVAHNVRVGEHSLLIAQAGIAGSAKLGSWCIVAGQAGVSGHVELGDRVRVAGKSGVTRNVEPGETIAGIHGLLMRDFLRQERAIRRLPRQVERLAELERRVNQLESQATHDQRDS